MTGILSADDAAAAVVFRYLTEVDALPEAKADAVIGFGIFDLALPQYCAELFTRGHARVIVFTGGMGAGTGNLGGPEAEAWRAEVQQSHPQLSNATFVIENRSTNTAENVGFTAEVLRETHPALAFGRGISSALLVASPSRLRRVRLTMRKLQPAVTVFRTSPSTTLAREQALYASHGIDYFAHLAGEIDRLVTYAERGWIAPEPVPRDVLVAAAALRGRTKTGG